MAIVTKSTLDEWARFNTVIDEHRPNVAPKPAQGANETTALYQEKLGAWRRTATGGVDKFKYHWQSFDFTSRDNVSTPRQLQVWLANNRADVSRTGWECGVADVSLNRYDATVRCRFHAGEEPEFSFQPAPNTRAERKMNHRWARGVEVGAKLRLGRIIAGYMSTENRWHFFVDDVESAPTTTALATP